MSINPIEACLFTEQQHWSHRESNFIAQYCRKEP